MDTTIKEGVRVIVKSLHHWQQLTGETGGYDYRNSIGMTGKVYKIHSNGIVSVDLDNGIDGFHYALADLELTEITAEESNANKLKQEIGLLERQLGYITNQLQQKREQLKEIENE